MLLLVLPTPPPSQLSLPQPPPPITTTLATKQTPSTQLPPMTDTNPARHHCRSVRVNGFVCKPAATVTTADFFSTLLVNPGATNNTFGSLVTAANVEKFPGVNTLGVSIARIDFAPGGLNPPHTHPRATEIVFVLKGELFVGFITTANKLFSQVIKKGEVFVFPKGLVHFQKNFGDKPAAVVAAFNSQLQGTVSIPTTLFAATPPVPDDVLAQAFQVNNNVVSEIKGKLAPKK